MRRRPLVLLATILVVLLLAACGALRLTGLGRLPVDVVVEKIELKRPVPTAEADRGGLLSQILDRVGDLASTLAGERSLELTLRVRNRLPLRATIRGARYTLSAGSREILAGSWHPATTAPACAPGEDFQLNITVKLDASSALGMAREKLAGEGPISLHGEVDATVLGIAVTRSFEVHHVEIDLFGTPAPRDSAPAPAAPETQEPRGDAGHEPRATNSPGIRV